MDDPIKDAREAAIAEKDASGTPYSAVVQRGIRTGQFDNGSIVRKHMKEPTWKKKQNK